jgi:predicted dehydrogenase
LHFEVAKQALEGGKHVFIEKPITRTLEEADELLAIARKTWRNRSDRTL